MTWTCLKCNNVNDDEADDCQACKQSKTPYYRKTLEQSKAVRDQFTVEVDPDERRWLEVLKVKWDFKSDSKVVKLCLENAINKQEVCWSEKTWRYVLSVKRQRLSNFQKLPEPTPNENAMQKP